LHCVRRRKSLDELPKSETQPSNTSVFNSEAS
jgi:hypothetical protein